MSVSFSSHLVYGALYTADDEKSTLKALADDFGGGWMKAKHVLSHSLEAPFYHSYPLLGARNNDDNMGGSLTNALSVYIRSSVYNLIPDSGNANYDAFPLELASLSLPNAEELAQLNEFVAKYPTKRNLGFFVLASIN